jgi:hypothetical protein
MTLALRAPLTHIVAALFMAGLAPACGGRTLGGSSGSVEPGDDSTVVTDGGTCIDIEVAPSDLSCASDQDCTLTLTGEVCDGQCSCGDTPVSTTAAARDESETASLRLADCACGFPGVPRCLGGQCTLCDGADSSTGCDDAGAITIEGGTYTVDAGTLKAVPCPQNAASGNFPTLSQVPDGEPCGPESSTCEFAAYGASMGDGGDPSSMSFGNINNWECSCKNAVWDCEDFGGAAIEICGDDQ